MEILNMLNDEQVEVVLSENPNCLVNAKVGSGKTTVLIAKIIYLHEFLSVPYRDMIVLTFTNKAANEIIDRIKLTDSSCSEMDIPYFGTFHSVALKMLKTLLPVESCGFTKDFSIITPEEEGEIAKRIATTEGLEIKFIEKVVKRLENAKKGKFLYGNMKKRDDIEVLLSLLSDVKIAQNKMTFDDLILYATRLVLLSEIKAKYIIIDELQDTNHNQFEFIKSLVGADTQLFAVGDPNQVIYTWRGSKKDVFDLFVKEFNTEVFTLSKNYRSCKNILDVAKIFSEDNLPLVATREMEEQITIREHFDPFNEAEYLASRIKEIVASGGSYRDIAVLYRLQSQSKIIEFVLRKEDIPFVISQKKTLKDIPVLRWLIRLLKSALNPEDVDSLLCVFSDRDYGLHLSFDDATSFIQNCIREKSLSTQLFLPGFLMVSKSYSSPDAIAFYKKIRDFQNTPVSKFSIKK